MSKKNLIKRLSWYYPLERFHTFITFPLITVFVILTNSLVNIVFLLYGLFIILLILLQGQHYWKLKLFRLRDQKINQKKNLKLFRKAKNINLIFIALVPLVFALQLFLTNKTPDSNNLMNWAIAANVFGILEHINYYHRQLMIDNLNDFNYLMRNKKLKVASLAKDLKRDKI